MDRHPAPQQTRADSHAFISLLKECISRKSLADGRRIHAHISQHCPHPHPTPLSNTLITMYAKCGSLADARRVFDSMRARDVVSWTVMVSGYAALGRGPEALALFGRMLREGVRPDRFAYIGALKACVTLGDVEQGRRVHGHMARSGIDPDVVLGSALIDMYAKCGSPHLARQVFDRMPAKNVVSWSAMICGYAHHGHGEEALRCFSKMVDEGLIPNEVTLTGAVKACAILGALQQGKDIHACTIKHGLEGDVFVAGSLVDMYVKCGSIELARRVFDGMCKRTAVSWTLMIAGYVQHEQIQRAFDLFRQMTEGSVKPNQVTYMAILKACSSRGYLEDGKHIHAQIVKDGFESDIRVGSTLVDMYAKCGSLPDACEVFDKMPTRNVVTWNALITGYIQHGRNEDARKAFWEMQRQGTGPDRITYTTILKACASPIALEEGKQIHMDIIKSGCRLDVFMGCALVSMYAKCGSLDLACRVFDEIPERDVALWNAVIAAYAQHGRGERALQAFWNMQSEGLKPDKFTVVAVLHACADMEALELGRQIHSYIVIKDLESDILVGNALIDMYAKCRSIKLAHLVFNKMPKRDVISWTALIRGYAKYGDEEKALKTFWLMQQEGIPPDNVTFATALNLCASLAALEQGRKVHKDMIDNKCEPDIFVENSLVNMYAKCGAMDQAHQAFNEMSKRDVASWNAIIAGYARNSNRDEVLEVFKQMCREHMKPDEVTFVCVLSACSHAGLLDEGQYYFNFMHQDNGIVPSEEHYACMVGLLGRFGNLQEAEECIHNMPLQSNAVVWMALLGASRIHGHLELARRSAASIFELEPQSCPTSVLLSNIYNAVGSLDDKSTRKGMEDLRSTTEWMHF